MVLPPVEAEAFLERKQNLLPGSKRASNRAWKNSYTVLCGQLLCFFKNKDDFMASKASGAPLTIHNASCSVAEDYHKRKYTFRLIIVDGSEFLFSCGSEVDMMDWVNKIKFRARLPPSQQLLHFDVPKVRSQLDGLFRSCLLINWLCRNQMMKLVPSQAERLALMLLTV